MRVRMPLVASPRRSARRRAPIVLAAAVVLLARPAGAHAGSEPGVTAAAARAADESLPPLDLADLLREAAANNPELAAARSRVAAAEAAPSQAEALPDPLASVSYTNDGLEDVTLGDTIMANLTFSWTQEVPYPGKRRLGGEVARRQTGVEERRRDLIRLRVFSQIKERYADLYRIDRTTWILHDSRDLLVSFMETARVRYETGAGILENVLKAQTEITRLDGDLEVLAQARRSTEAALAALVGRTGEASFGPAVALPESAAVPDEAALEAEAQAFSPEILESEAAVLRDEARLDLAKRQLKPDLMWGAAYVNRGDIDPMVMGMFGLRLPLYRERKQVQGIVQTRHELDAAKQDVASVRLRVASEVRDLAARAGRAGTLARLYGEGIIPQARNALESASASYGVGRVDFLTLLDDFTKLLTFEIEHETQRSERVAALAALERLTGRELVPVGPSGEASDGGMDE